MCSRHWQLIQENGHVSREKLCKDLGLGEGTIKTLVRHLKMHNLIESTNAGTTMTKKGNSFFSELLSSIPSEISLSKCAITLGKFNYAVLVKKMSSMIKDGIAQRDAELEWEHLVQLPFCSKTTNFLFHKHTLIH